MKKEDIERVEIIREFLKDQVDWKRNDFILEVRWLVKQLDLHRKIAKLVHKASKLPPSFLDHLPVSLGVFKALKDANYD